MKGSSQDIKQIGRVLSGKRLSWVEARSDAQIDLGFDDGASLVITAVGGRLSLDFAAPGRDPTCPVGVWPTIRQREYLEFITKYIVRFGRSPAESDIQRHFLVSAPSVNHMVQGLERRGFIARQPGVPRSIRVVAPGPCALCGGSHHVKSVGRRPATREAS